MKTEDKAIVYADGIIENCQLDSTWNCEEIHWQLRDAYLAGHSDLQAENAQLKEVLKELVDTFDNEKQSIYSFASNKIDTAKKLLEQFK